MRNIILWWQCRCRRHRCGGRRASGARRRHERDAGRKNTRLGLAWRFNLWLAAQAPPDDQYRNHGKDQKDVDQGHTLGAARLNA